MSPEERTPDLEEREVRSSDPRLSAETNARLTEELQDIVGAEQVQVPRSRPRIAEGEYRTAQTWSGYLTQNRVSVVRFALIALTFGAIVALVTNVWWLLPLAAGVHALGTMAVTAGTIHLTTVSEHPSPTLAAALAEEGIGSADEHFTQIVDEFRPAQSGATGDVLSAGEAGRTVSASEQPALAGAEQSSAMTPTAEPSAPSPAGGTPDALIWTTLAGLAIVSFIIPPINGNGWMWLLPVVTLPLIGGAGWLQITAARRPEKLQVHGPGQIAALTLIVVVAVAAFCVVVAVGLQSS
jgi:hypothetical protein